MKEPISKRTKHFYSFGPYRLYRAERELFRDEEPVDLSPKSLDALLLLVNHHGHVVSKEEFMTALWPEAFVEEANLARHISDLRRALGGPPEGRAYIETVARRGYRFTAKVTESWDEKPVEHQLGVIGDYKNETPGRTPARERIAWLIAAVCFAGMVAVTWLYFRQTTLQPAPPVVRKLRSTLPGKPSWGLMTTHTSNGVSPDGKYLAFSGLLDRGLWVYDFASGTSRVLPGIPIANDPFWSPDSAFIGYSAASQIYKVSVRGGTPTPLGSSRDLVQGAAWSPDGASIVFSSRGTLYEMPGLGGTAKLLVSPEGLRESWDGPAGQKGLIRHPRFLPSEAGRRVLVYSFESGTEQMMMVHDLENDRREVLVPGDYPVYSPSGHLVYQQNHFEDNLWALPFSLDTLQATGQPFPIAEGGAFPAVTPDQTLVYHETAASPERLVWLDRGGVKVGEFGRAREFIQSPAISPDGNSVAVSASVNANQDIWVSDVSGGRNTRLTSGHSADGGPVSQVSPVWSPTGEEILVSADGDILKWRTDGSGEAEKLVATADRDRASDWSRDGRYILFERLEAETSHDLWYLERKQGGGWEPKPLLRTPSSERQAKLSPDGRFVAYSSDESGRSEIYVRPFPEGGAVIVSGNGGETARWSRDGRELFYVEDRVTLVSVPIMTGSTFSMGPPTTLFDHPSLARRSSPQFDTVDAERFLLAEPVEEAQTQIRVVLNWYEEFRDRERD